MDPLLYKSAMPLVALMTTTLSKGCRLLDIFACKAVGVDPMSLPCKEKVLRKLILYYAEASETERAIILKTFPMLAATALLTSLAATQLRASERVGVRFCSSASFGKLSAASIWTRQNAFYAGHAMGAWSSIVPCEISSNLFIAHKYSDIIEATAAAQLSPPVDMGKRPSKALVCVLEIGAGHGLLSFLISRELQRRNSSDFVFRIICTDFHDAIFKKLLTYPWIQHQCATGCLDFAVLKAGIGDGAGAVPLDAPIQLLYSNTDLSTLHSDLVIIVANYAFDSFPVDIIIKGDCCDSHFGIGVKTNAERSERKRKRGTESAKTESSRSDTNQSTPFKTSKRRSPVSNPYCCFMQLDGYGLLADIVMSSDRFGPGAHVLPIAGFTLMKAVRYCFKNTTSFAMIVGDYFVCSDSKAWQLDNFKNTSNALSSRGVLRDTSPIHCDWFDPPLISPSTEVCAFPVTVDALLLAFNMAFMDDINRTVPDILTWLDELIMPMFSTVLHPSSFSIVSMHANLTNRSLMRMRLEQSVGILFQNTLNFGPNELAHIRLLLKEDISARLLLSHIQWKHCFNLTCFDMIFFLEHMWDIRRAIISAASKDVVTDWCDLIQSSYFRQLYVTSIGEFCIVRERLASWMLSLQEPEAAVALYLTHSYSFLNIVLLLRAKQLTRDESEPLMSHLLAQIKISVNSIIRMNKESNMADCLMAIRRCDPLLASTSRHWMCSKSLRIKTLLRALKELRLIWNDEK